MSYFKHPLADVQSNHIGADSRIWQYVVILPGAIIGRRCNINAHCFIENDVSIGDDVTVKCGVYLWDGLELGNDVFIGPNVTFTNDLYPRSKQHLSSYTRTVICCGVSIGAGSTIIAGVTIGDYAMIGAGSLVTSNVPPQTLWYGSPATFKGYVCLCGMKLGESGVCERCGRKLAFPG